MKITNRKDLAIALDNNKVSIDLISKRLNNVVKMWIGYGDVKKEGNYIVGQF